MSGHLFLLLENLVFIVITAVVFAVLGWWMRGKKTKPGPSRQADSTAERNRLRGVEDRLKKAEADAASAAAHLAELQKSSAPRSELAAAQTALAAEKERADGLNAQLKKQREQQQATETRKTDSGKAQQNRVFELENQLAKSREEVARAKLAAEEARAEISKVKGAGSSSAKEIKDLQNQVLGLRTTAQAATKSLDELRATHETATVELKAARDRIAQIERDLAAAQARSRIADKNAPAAAALSTPRGISEEQFAAVRSALVNAQRDRDAAQSKCDDAVEEAEAARAEVKDLKARLAQLTGDEGTPRGTGDSAVG
jgi:chromosome segregation ATPase